MVSSSVFCDFFIVAFLPRLDCERLLLLALRFVPVRAFSCCDLELESALAVTRADGLVPAIFYQLSTFAQFCKKADKQLGYLSKS